MAKTQDAQFYAAARISENIVETPEGFLLCIGVPIARTGDLLYGQGELLNAEGEEVIESLDGKITITRDADALFNPKTMATFEGKAVTIGHPADWVSPLTWQNVSNGHMQNVRPGTGTDADKLLADLLIVTAQAISLIRGGIREVSLGYDATYEQLSPGVGRQTGIMGNHVALVRKGRNGNEVAVRDSAPEIKPKGITMTAKDKLMKLLGRAIDEAMPEDKKPTVDEGGDIDSRIANIEAMLTKLAEGGGTADAVPPAAGDPPAAGGVTPELDSRLTAIEQAIAKLIEMKGDGAPVVDGEDGKAAADDDALGAKVMDSVVMAKDHATVEILVPGFAVTDKTTVGAVLEQFGKTTDGATVLKTLDGIKDANVLFSTAAELVKARGNGLQPLSIQNFPALRAQTGDAAPKGARTPEQINEANNKRYGLK